MKRSVRSLGYAQIKLWYILAIMDTLLFQYCQKIVVFSDDFSRVLLAKRQGEQDYDGVFTFIGGKLETTDGGIIEGLRRENNEEVGAAARIAVLPTLTSNIYFQKKDGHHMLLPHYAAHYTGGEIALNEEYSEYAWVAIEELSDFEPKIDNIPESVRLAQQVISLAKDDEWITL